MSPASNRYGLTVDQAVTRLMEAARIPAETERRKAFRDITTKVCSLAYHEGSEDQRAHPSDERSG